MKNPPSDSYSASSEVAPDGVLVDWIQAIEEFDQWYSKLNEVIHGRNSINYLLVHEAAFDTKWSLTDLIQLWLDVNHGLANLEREINVANREDSTLLKIQRLRMHTKTILGWNKTIQKALGLSCSGTA